MEDETKFYEAVMLRKEKVGIKKWKEFLPTLFDPYLSKSYLTMEDAFENFTKNESVRFILLEYKYEDEKHILTTKSLYTGNIFNIKSKFDFSIT